MIVIHMTNTYDLMHRRIYWWLISKRKKCHALLEWKRNKDDIIPWCNNISHVGYIHPLVHGNLHVTVNKLNLFKANLIKQNVTIKLYTMDNPSTSRDCFNSSNLSMPPTRLIYSLDHFVSSLSKWLNTNDHKS